MEINYKVQTKKHDILGNKFDLVSYNVVLNTIELWRRQDECHYVTISNPHSVLLCERNPQMQEAHDAADLTLPDGTGIILAARMLGYEHSGRVTGPNLMLYLCDRGRRHNLRHFFYGGGEGVAETLADKLCVRYPGLSVVGTYSPPFRPLGAEEDSKVIEWVNDTKPDIVWVGLGAPKQEVWMLNHIGQIETSAMIGVGAAFDFHSGNVKWAPGFIRKAGLEWAWRLVTNPKGMWRRNIDSPLFLSKVFVQKIRFML